MLASIVIPSRRSRSGFVLFFFFFNVVLLCNSAKISGVVFIGSLCYQDIYRKISHQFILLDNIVKKSVPSKINASRSSQVISNCFIILV